MLASRKLIQSWLSGTNGDGGTSLHRETRGNHLFWFWPLCVCSPRSLPLPPPQLCRVFVLRRLRVSHPVAPNKAELFRRVAVIIWALCSQLQRLKRSGCWRCSAVTVVKTLELLEKNSFSLFSGHEKNQKSLAHVDASVSSIVKLPVVETAAMAPSLNCVVPL